MLLCTPLRGWSIHYATVAEIITYSLLTFFLLKKNTQHMGMCLLGIIIGRYVLDLPFRFIDFRGTLISLMVSMGSLLGILLGFTYFKVKRWIVLVVSAIVVFVFSFVLEPQWRDYVAYGSLPEGLNVSTFKVETANDSLEIASIHKKYVVLDFLKNYDLIYREYKNEILNNTWYESKVNKYTNYYKKQEWTSM